MPVSDAGFSPKVWGPPLWKTLHIMSANYEPNRRVGRTGRRSSRCAYERFFDVLGDTLPCAACRANYPKSRALAEARLARERGGGTPFDSRRNMQRFVYLLHDAVNMHLGKKSPPFCDVVRKCERSRVKR